jgi:hypothetical protein
MLLVHEARKHVCIRLTDRKCKHVWNIAVVGQQNLYYLLSVCVCVCVYVLMYVCMYVCTYVCVYVIWNV